MNEEMILVLMARTDAVRDFASETTKKIEEFEMYNNMGILGDDMSMVLQAEIAARVVAADIELNLIKAMMIESELDVKWPDISED